MDARLPGGHEPVRVVLVARDPLALAGLSSLLAGRPGCRVVAELGSPDDLPLVSGFDVVLWDAAGAEGPPASEEQPVLALLPAGAKATGLMRRGVRGLVFRDADAATIEAALVALAHGLAVQEPGMLRDAPGADGYPEPEELTPRELEVLQHLAEGLSNKRIAARLDISDHTVKFHVNAVLGKLGASTRTEAVVRAARLGLIVV